MRNKGAYVWMLFGKVGPQAIYLLTTILLARILTPNEFGQVGVLAVFISIATTLNDAGLGGSLIKEQNVTDIDYATINIFNIGVSLLLYLFLFISAGLLENYFHSDGLKEVTRSLSLVFLIYSISAVPRTILLKELKFKTISWISLTSVIISSIIALALAKMNAGVYALVAYQLNNALVSGILMIIKSRYHFKLRFSFASLKKLIPFGIYTTLSNVVDNIYENILVFAFGKVLDIRQAGYLSQAKKLDDAAIAGCKDTINTVSFPVLAKLQYDNGSFIAESKSILINVSKIVLPLFFTVSIFSTEIIKLLFGNEWLNSANYLSLLFIAGIFILIESLYRNFIKSHGEVNLLFKFTLYKRLLTILVIIVLALTQPSLILFGYILGAIIGLLVNIALFAKIMSLTFGSELKIFLKNSLLPSFFALMVYGTKTYVPNTAVVYSACSLIWVIYYVIVLYQLGYLHIFKNKRQL